jgi:hypothetical protein
MPGGELWRFGLWRRFCCRVLDQGLEQRLRGSRKKLCIVSERFLSKCQRSATCLADAALPASPRSRKRASAIPADELHTGMGKPPLFARLGFSIGKQVDGNPPFEIDEDRSIAPAAAKTKIIHTQHPRRGYLALFRLSNQPRASSGDWLPTPSVLPSCFQLLLPWQSQSA